MKVFNKKKIEMSSSLLGQLGQSRLLRKFDAQQYIKNKGFLLNKYFRKNNLKTAIVAVSGGVDSAVVLNLAYYAKAIKDSPIQEIIPVYMPANEGMTNHDESYLRAEELCHSLNLGLKVLDLTKTHTSLLDTSTNYFGEQSNWVKGQLVPCLRTASLYLLNNIFWNQNKNSVILGTINKSEGSYIGFMGKAGDAMVDLQVISDIYKSD